MENHTRPWAFAIKFCLWARRGKKKTWQFPAHRPGLWLGSFVSYTSAAGCHWTPAAYHHWVGAAASLHPSALSEDICADMVLPFASHVWGMNRMVGFPEGGAGFVCLGCVMIQLSSCMGFNEFVWPPGLTGDFPLGSSALLVCLFHRGPHGGAKLFYASINVLEVSDSWRTLAVITYWNVIPNTTYVYYSIKRTSF